MPTTATGLEGLTSLSGADLGRTDWQKITQERVNTFADATGDHQWIHTDPEKAKDGPLRRSHRPRLPHPFPHHPALR